MSDWTHFDTEGRPVMVDVGGKNVTERTAAAECFIQLPEKIYRAVAAGDLAKGDPISVAELGGIMGAKKTSELIPLCHNIKLNSVTVRCELDSEKAQLRIFAHAKATDVTGVEMEALTAVSVAALVFYDMCKGLDKGMVISGLRLLQKTGGKSGTWSAQ